MHKQPDKDGQNDLEAEVWNAISAFEQILEAIPDDRASLEALANAYEQIGDHTRAKDYLIRLGTVLIKEKDIPAVKDVLAHIKDYAMDHSGAADLVAKMEVLVAPAAGEDTVVLPNIPEELPKEKPKSTDGVRVTFNMADELSFAWNLLEAKELTQEEYASVVQDLTEMSSVENATTVSVLHVLEGRGFKGLERIMVYISKDCSTPIIALTNFDVKQEVAQLLPLDFAMRRGALVFELIGKDALAVVMNPYDKQIKKDVEAVVGKRCHFFLTLPSEFDKTLDKAMGIQKERNKADGNPGAKK